MLGKFLKCEADKNIKFYRVIQTLKEYSDGRRFPINEVVVANKKINFNAEEQADMGGFCISTLDYIFRWLIRGDTLNIIFQSNDCMCYMWLYKNCITSL